MAPDFGWNTCEVALELQAPYSQYILDGTKTIETRRYKLPSALLGRDLLLLETPEGITGVSGLPDEIEEGLQGARLIGTVRFESNLEYASKDQWVNDANKHRVPLDSAYAFTTKGSVFGWTVSHIHRWDRSKPVPRLRRRYRSLFEVLTSSIVPVVDLGGFVEGDEQARQQVVREVSEQCERIGFLFIRWKNLDTKLIRQAHSVARTFFEQAMQEKQKSSKSSIDKKTSSFTSTGYRAAQTTENNRNRESWSCSVPEYEFMPEEYYTCSDGQKHFALPPDPQVPWPSPETLPTFRSSVCGYYRMMEEVSSVLLRIFAAAMGCEDDALLRYTSRHISSLNLFSSTTGQGGGIAQVHGDADCFTILSHDHSPGSVGCQCLEFQTPSGAWETVPRYNEDVLLVNVGQIMERWSGGRFKVG
eukprot:scaffold3826_cov407-Prasinococcus_capsulatus_cf.AAC.15